MLGGKGAAAAAGEDAQQGAQGRREGEARGMVVDSDCRRIDGLEFNTEMLMLHYLTL